MAGNTDPIYSRRGAVAAVGTASPPTMATPITAATTAGATSYDGSDANAKLVFTADATNGSFIQRLRFKAGNGNNVATVARVFINNGSANTTASNNAFYDEISLPATTAVAAAATASIDLQMNFAIPAGYRIYVSLGTAVSGGWWVTPIAGDY